MSLALAADDEFYEPSSTAGPIADNSPSKRKVVYSSKQPASTAVRASVPTVGVVVDVSPGGTSTSSAPDSPLAVSSPQNVVTEATYEPEDSRSLCGKLFDTCCWWYHKKPSLKSISSVNQFSTAFSHHHQHVLSPIDALAFNDFNQYVDGICFKLTQMEYAEAAIVCDMARGIFHDAQLSIASSAQLIVENGSLAVIVAACLHMACNKIRPLPISVIMYLVKTQHQVLVERSADVVLDCENCDFDVDDVRHTVDSWQAKLSIDVVGLRGEVSSLLQAIMLELEHRHYSEPSQVIQMAKALCREAQKCRDSQEENFLFGDSIDVVVAAAINLASTHFEYIPIDTCVTMVEKHYDNIENTLWFEDNRMDLSLLKLNKKFEKSYHNIPQTPLPYSENSENINFNPSAVAVDPPITSVDNDDIAIDIGNPSHPPEQRIGEESMAGLRPPLAVVSAVDTGVSSRYITVRGKTVMRKTGRISVDGVVFPSVSQRILEWGRRYLLVGRPQVMLQWHMDKFKSKMQTVVKKHENLGQFFLQSDGLGDSPTYVSERTYEPLKLPLSRNVNRLVERWRVGLPSDIVGTSKEASSYFYFAEMILNSNNYPNAARVINQAQRIYTEAQNSRDSKNCNLLQNQSVATSVASAIIIASNGFQRLQMSDVYKLMETCQELWNCQLQDNNNVDSNNNENTVTSHNITNTVKQWRVRLPYEFITNSDVMFVLFQNISDEMKKREFPNVRSTILAAREIYYSAQNKRDKDNFNLLQGISVETAVTAAIQIASSSHSKISVNSIFSVVKQCMLKSRDKHVFPMASTSLSKTILREAILKWHMELPEEIVGHEYVHISDGSSSSSCDSDESSKDDDDEFSAKFCAKHEHRRSSAAVPSVKSASSIPMSLTSHDLFVGQFEDCDDAVSPAVVDFDGRLTPEQQAALHKSHRQTVKLLEILNICKRAFIFFVFLLLAVLASTILWSLFNMPYNSNKFNYRQWFDLSKPDVTWLLGNVVTAGFYAVYRLLSEYLILIHRRRTSKSAEVGIANSKAYMALLEKGRQTKPVIFSDDWIYELSLYRKAKDSYLKQKSKIEDIKRTVRPYKYFLGTWAVSIVVFTSVYLILPVRGSIPSPLTITDFFGLFVAASSELRATAIFTYFIYFTTILELFLFVITCIFLNRQDKKKTMASHGLNVDGTVIPVADDGYVKISRANLPEAAAIVSNVSSASLGLKNRKSDSIGQRQQKRALGYKLRRQGLPELAVGDANAKRDFSEIIPKSFRVVASAGGQGKGNLFVTTTTESSPLFQPISLPVLDPIDISNERDFFDETASQPNSPTAPPRHRRAPPTKVAAGRRPSTFLQRHSSVMSSMSLVSTNDSEKNQSNRESNDRRRSLSTNASDSEDMSEGARHRIRRKSKVVRSFYRGGAKRNSNATGIPLRRMMSLLEYDGGTPSDGWFETEWSRKLDGVVLLEDTCLLIACHRSVLDAESQAAFESTLRHALMRFPATAIFVCDNGDSLVPVDPNKEVCKRISQDFYPDGSQLINYLYLPEGNKTTAIYWATEFWIPALVSRGLSEDFSYAIVLDDDVPIPESLSIPYKVLDDDPAIMCVAYTLQAVSADGKSNILVDLQDVEYQTVGCFKEFQSKLGSCISNHGAIALWRRSILGDEILFRHNGDFHGEDLYQGILLHRLNRGYKVYVSSLNPVPTYCPSTFISLFVQRACSWDLVAERKVFSLFGLLVSYWRNAWAITKPFLFMEVMTVAADWLRVIFIIQMLVISGWTRVGLGAVTILNLFIAFLQAICYNYWLQRHRPDLKQSFGVICLVPFYRLLTLMFRQAALLENALRYLPYKVQGDRICDRVQRTDKMPLPPVPEPLPYWPFCRWDQVWVAIESKESTASSEIRSKDLATRFIKGGGWKWQQVHRHRDMVVRSGVLGTTDLIPLPILNFIDHIVCGGTSPVIQTIDPRFQPRLRHLMRSAVVSCMLLFQNVECGSSIVKLSAVCFAMEHTLKLCVCFTKDEYASYSSSEFNRSKILSTVNAVIDSYILQQLRSLKSDRPSIVGAARAAVEDTNAFLQFPSSERFEIMRKVKMNSASKDECRIYEAAVPLSEMEIVTGIVYWWQREFRSKRLIRAYLLNQPSASTTKKDRVLRLFRIWATNVRVMEGILYTLLRLNEPSSHDRTKEVKEVIMSIFERS